jgi:ABC-type nickel/cobalt efflux system permease component RcnA
MSEFPIIFGFAAAMAHVLSGPDHLAAVAPLALNTKFRPWIIGMAWGIGHLTGMLLLGVLFFFFKEIIPIEFISSYSERIVGFLLIAIGLWSILRLFKHNWKRKHSHLHAHLDDKGQVVVHQHGHDHSNTKKHEHTHEELAHQTYWAAMSIGILHGLAGFSHILHMLPTLAFPTKLDSGLYLLGFGGGTIFGMVLFSFILGLIANYSKQGKKDTIYQSINALAGFAAICIGFYWLWITW